ncbi:MAG: hypothetical protein SWZ49_20650 [Cyanobacteriota bacterium]|nr:hypothetical protein [Cyanobacteriota bacterium]
MDVNRFSSKVRFTVKLLALLFLSIAFLGACRRVESTSLTCLPESRQLTDVIVPFDSSNNFKTVTISEKLQEIEASCDSERLIDGEGKEIVFSNRIQSCGGAGFDEEMLQQRRKELETLRQKYTVIVVQCKNNGIPLP